MTQTRREPSSRVGTRSSRAPTSATKARGSAPRPGPDWLGSVPGAASQGDAR